MSGNNEVSGRDYRTTEDRMTAYLKDQGRAQRTNASAEAVAEHIDANGIDLHGAEEFGLDAFRVSEYMVGRAALSSAENQKLHAWLNQEAEDRATAPSPARAPAAPGYDTEEVSAALAAIQAELAELVAERAARR